MGLISKKNGCANAETSMTLRFLGATVYRLLEGDPYVLRVGVAAIGYSDPGGGSSTAL